MPTTGLAIPAPGPPRLAAAPKPATAPGVVAVGPVMAAELLNGMAEVGEAVGRATAPNTASGTTAAAASGRGSRPGRQRRHLPGRSAGAPATGTGVLIRLDTAGEPFRQRAGHRAPQRRNEARGGPARASAGKGMKGGGWLTARGRRSLGRSPA